MAASRVQQQTLLNSHFCCFPVYGLDLCCLGCMLLIHVEVLVFFMGLSLRRTDVRRSPKRTIKSPRFCASSASVDLSERNIYNMADVTAVDEGKLSKK